MLVFSLVAFYVLGQKLREANTSLTLTRRLSEFIFIDGTMRNGASFFLNIFFVLFLFMCVCLSICCLLRQGNHQKELLELEL